MAARKRNPGHKTTKSMDCVDPLSAFFASYPTFSYDENKGVAEEFYRMCSFFSWDNNDDRRHDAQRAFKNALVLRFNGIYGTDASRLDNWHKLCVVLGIEPLPTSIDECKEAVSQVHVNLVDLVDNSQTRVVNLFDSLDGLREYTKSTGKYFPKKSAYAGGLLRYLLREIFG